MPKVKITISIDKNLKERFGKYCKKHCMKISTRINHLIKKELERKK